MIIEKSCANDVLAMQGIMREADQRECWAVSHETAGEALMKSFTRSELCWTAFDKDKRQVFMFGVANGSLLFNNGYVWLLGTTRMEKTENKIGLLKISKPYIKKMLAPYEMIENYVDARNALSIKWLKWCGFTIEPMRVYGIERKMFHHFWMLNSEKESVYV